jgi:microcystin-dependent protein
VRIQASTINLSVSTATSNIAVASAAPILSASSVNANITLADAGASQPVNLKQPTATLNYFIKAL